MHCRQFTICIAQNTHYLPPPRPPSNFAFLMFPFFPECYSPRVTERKTSACFLFYLIIIIIIIIVVIILKAGREVLLFIMEKGKGDELKQIIILKRIKR